MNTIDSKIYREGMSHLASAVTVVCSDGKAGKGGLTVSAITSVTDSPATLLVCINQNAKMNELIKQHGKFSVNVLQTTQEAISNRMAGFDGSEVSARFDLGVWEKGVLNQPILKGTSVAFECEVIKSDDVGTHTVFYGEVKKLHFSGEEETTPLMYFNRKYQRFQMKEPLISE